MAELPGPEQVAFRRSLREAAIQYGTCAHPDCPRIVPLGILYCCGPCSSASGAPGPYYRLIAHSDGCEERQSEYAPAIPPDAPPR